MMNEQMQQLLDNLKRRNFEALYCQTRDDVHAAIMDRIQESATVGFSGSQTLEQLEIVEMLQSRGNNVLNQYDPNLSRDESLRIRRLSIQSDCYLCSANAVSMAGELVFLSAYGHRIAAIAAASRVIVVCGTNKVVADRAAAIKRAREHAAPLNVKRLHWDTPCAKDGICHEDICFAPEYIRMCCQMFVLESEVDPERLTVIIAGETLGL
ncbi:MAG: lactate utilization protein [Candidatus Omnitrophica bacterium]|nr:lactate utilization protein [Candidatus Omnitrophota bacterium]MDD5774953.1 lactate utilization protein [Candidatus Omnitrophota bacterium]